jgi:hypothetical protein
VCVSLRVCVVVQGTHSSGVVRLYHSLAVDGHLWRESLSPLSRHIAACPRRSHALRVCVAARVCGRAAVVTVLPPQSRAVIVAETPSTMHAAEQPSPRGLEERQNVRSRQLNFAQASRRQHSHGELQLQDMRRAANLKSSARRDDGALIDWGQGSVTPADHGTPASVLGSPTGSWKPAQLPVGTAVPLPLKRGQPIQYYVVCSLRVALVVASRELRAAGHGH